MTDLLIHFQIHQFIFQLITVRKESKRIQGDTFKLPVSNQQFKNQQLKIYNTDVKSIQDQLKKFTMKKQQVFIFED